MAVGEKALMMQGRTHEDIKVIRPLKDGVIANSSRRTDDN